METNVLQNYENYGMIKTSIQKLTSFSCEKDVAFYFFRFILSYERFL